MPVNRRDAFRVASLAAIGMTFARGTALADAPRVTSARPETPEQAFGLLVEGNKRFKTQNLTSFAEDLAIMRADTEEKQEPFAAVLSCADSRVPVELLFDQSIGHVFVVRIAGNIATSDAIASLEYGAAVLGTKAILVLGHSNCGAVKATIAGKDVPGQISTLFPYIRPAIENSLNDLAAATAKNAAYQASLLSKASPILSEMISQRKLAIRAAIYDVGSGDVHFLDS